LKLAARIYNIKSNWKMQQYVGKVFRSRAIVGHWYPIVSIELHEHAMTIMMVLRQGYALVFVSSNARMPFQRMDYSRCGC